MTKKLTLRVQPGGSFPSFIPKTDVDRIQNHIEYFDTLKDMQFEVTEKLDGTSCTIYYWGEDGFSCQGVCSRNYDVSYTENVYTAIEKKYNIIERIKRTARNLAIQGEIVDFLRELDEKTLELVRKEICILLNNNIGMINTKFKGVSK